jgi:hypothetical protein
MGLGISKGELAELLHTLIAALEGSPGEYRLAQKMKLEDAIRKAKELKRMLELQAIDELP